MNEKKEHNSKRDIMIRMKRIEGQVKGIEKMIENDANCKDILIQVAAIRAAINRAGTLILQNYAQNCFVNDNTKDNEKIEQLVKIINMFLK